MATYQCAIRGLCIPAEFLNAEENFYPSPEGTQYTSPWAAECDGRAISVTASFPYLFRGTRALEDECCSFGEKRKRIQWFTWSLRAADQYADGNSIIVYKVKAPIPNLLVTDRTYFNADRPPRRDDEEEEEEEGSRRLLYLPRELIGCGNIGIYGENASTSFDQWSDETDAALLVGSNYNGWINEHDDDQVMLYDATKWLTPVAAFVSRGTSNGFGINPRSPLSPYVRQYLHDLSLKYKMIDGSKLSRFLYKSQVRMCPGCYAMDVYPHSAVRCETCHELFCSEDCIVRNHDCSLAGPPELPPTYQYRKLSNVWK